MARTSPSPVVPSTGQRMSRGAAVHREAGDRRQIAGQVRHAVHPVPALDDLPPQAAVRLDGVRDRRRVLLGDLGEGGQGLSRQTEKLREEAHAVEHAPERWIGHASSEAVLGGRGTRRQVPTEAPAVEHDPVGVDVGTIHHGVDDGRDHPLPVGDHGDAVVDEQRALARAVEEQAVVPPLGRRPTCGQVHVGHRGVIAVRGDEERPSLARGSRDEVRRQRAAVERDRQRLSRPLTERHGLVEGAHLAVEGRPQAGIDGRAVERVVGHARVAGGPEPVATGGGMVPGGGRLLRRRPRDG